MEEIDNLMSLFKDVSKKCQILNKSTVLDGYGGYKTVWTDGAEFDAMISYDDSTQGLAAQAQGVTSLYTVLTSRALNLQYHDVFRQLSDGKIFRVTTDGDDNETPKSSALDLRSVRAEEWELPTGSEV